MKTFLFNEYQTILANATEKGFAVWHDTNRYDDEMIGIENKRSIVYWYQISENGHLYFDHAYNRNSGKTYKGFTMGFNFKNKMIYND